MRTGFSVSLDGKESTCGAGDLGSILGLGRSPGGGHGSPLQYSCRENPTDRDKGAWGTAVPGVAESDTPEVTEHTHSDGLGGKESTCNAGDTGSIPGSGRSPGEGHSNSLQYSCLENLMVRGVWWATVHRISKSRT